MLLEFRPLGTFLTPKFKSRFSLASIALDCALDALFSSQTRVSMKLSCSSSLLSALNRFFSFLIHGCDVAGAWREPDVRSLLGAYREGRHFPFPFFRGCCYRARRGLSKRPTFFRRGCSLFFAIISLFPGGRLFDSISNCALSPCRARSRLGLRSLLGFKEDIILPFQHPFSLAFPCPCF